MKLLNMTKTSGLIEALAEAARLGERDALAGVPDDRRTANDIRVLCGVVRWYGGKSANQSRPLLALKAAYRAAHLATVESIREEGR